MRAARALRDDVAVGGDAHELADLQHEIDALDGWTGIARHQRALTQLSLDAATKVATLSGGLKKRVAIARALVAVAGPAAAWTSRPTIWTLAAIAWLEDLLRAFALAR